MKRIRITSLFLMILMLTSMFTSMKINAVTTVDTAPQFAKENQLYAQGIEKESSAQAWQQWCEYSDSLYAEEGVKYFFLPQAASDKEFMVYNSYNSAVVVNGVEISSKSAKSISYVQGEKCKAVCNGREYTYMVYKSDSDASLYINDTKGSYTNSYGMVFNDFYEFLTDDKQNSVSGSDISVVSKDAVMETTLKKIKGRGNTTWRESDKKPFNITFNSIVSVDGLSGKKFSMMSNSREGTLLRNKIMYDLADAVQQPYSADTRFIDLYINGIYRGSFQLSQKAEMGKNSLIALQDTTDSGATENFNFAVEIDIWNYQNDTHFTSSTGQEICLNTPELKDYNPNDATQRAQMTFIQDKYNEFENALYNGNMASLEAICDIESLAKAYLLNEFSKNCDGGLCSTYYTYNAGEGKFYACPVWDFDSGLGNVDCQRGGADLSTCEPTGWLTRTITNNNSSWGPVNTLGQAFNLSGTTSDGKTFYNIVRELWNSKFVPAINYLLGNSQTSVGRLKTITDYQKAIEKSSYINYLMWDFAWGPIDYSYPSTYQGQIDYLKDWTNKRFLWMSAQFQSDIDPTNPTTDPSKKTYYLAGTGFGGWDSQRYPLTINSDGTATIKFTFIKGTYYHFKVVEYTGRNITNYYTADFNDEETAKYFISSGEHENADFTPDEDTPLVITFDIQRGVFTAVPDVSLEGDVNDDGVLDVKDVTAIQKYIASIILTLNNLDKADYNGDGKINICDATAIQKAIAQ